MLKSEIGSLVNNNWMKKELRERESSSLLFFFLLENRIIYLVGRGPFIKVIFRVNYLFRILEEMTHVQGYMKFFLELDIIVN